MEGMLRRPADDLEQQLDIGWFNATRNIQIAGNLFDPYETINLGLDALPVERAYAQECCCIWMPGIEIRKRRLRHAYPARLHGVPVVHQSALRIVQFGKDVSMQITREIADTPYDFVLWHIG